MGEINDVTNPELNISAGATPSKSATTDQQEANMPSITNPWANEAKGQGSDWKMGKFTNDEEDWSNTTGPEGLPSGKGSLGMAFDGGTDEMRPTEYDKGVFTLEGGSDEGDDVTPNTAPKEEQKNEVTPDNTAPVTKVEANEPTTEVEELRKRVDELEKRDKKLTKRNKELEDGYSAMKTEVDRLSIEFDRLALDRDEELQNALDPEKRKEDFDLPYKKAYDPMNAEIQSHTQDLLVKTSIEGAKLDPLFGNKAPIVPPPLPQSEVPPVVPQPEVAKAPEVKTDEEKRKEEERLVREERKRRFIMGVVGAGAGLTTAVLAGATIATGTIAPIAAAVVAASLGNKALSEWRARSLNSKIENTKDAEEKAKLTKRKEGWERMAKWSNRILAFSTGFGGGLIGGSFLSNALMGGKGLLTGGLASHTPVTGAEANPVANTGHNVDTRSATSAGSTLNTGSANANIGSGVETNTFDSGLIQNGRIHLPGSAWDGNLASKATGALNGGEFNSLNYPGGATNMGAFELNNALNSAKISVNSLPTSVVHRLLNMYQANPQTNLTSALQSLGVAQ